MTYAFPDDHWKIEESFETPVQVTCLGMEAISAHWSTGGLRISEFEGPLPETGAIISLLVSFKLKDISVALDCEGEVDQSQPAAKAFSIKFRDYKSSKLNRNTMVSPSKSAIGEKAQAH